MDSPLPAPKRPRSSFNDPSDDDDAVVPKSKPLLAHPKTISGLRKFMSYVFSEFSSDDLLSMVNPQLNKRIQNFLKVPKECERFLWYGFLVCLDSFLYVFSILPIRY